MKPLSTIYWIRVPLAITASLISVALSMDNLYSVVSVALLFYVITNYLLKYFFETKVKKSSKIITTGIGTYFLTWIVTLALFYTLRLWLLGLLPTG